MSFKKVVVMLLAVSMLIGIFTGVAPSQAAEKSYTKRELKVLSTIIYCEAGNQSFAGKLAVGCVVMNRKRSKGFPNTVEGVIRQRGQFGPVWSGKFSKEKKLYAKGAYKKGARAQCVKAAKQALAGRDYVNTRGKRINMRKYHFFNGSLRHAKIRIGGHDFK